MERKGAVEKAFEGEGQGAGGGTSIRAMNSWWLREKVPLRHNVRPSSDRVLHNGTEGVTEADRPVAGNAHTPPPV